MHEAEIEMWYKTTVILEWWGNQLLNLERIDIILLYSFFK